jgi:hypothetical protein
MTEVAAVSELTATVPWARSTDIPAVRFEVAVPSDNFGAEPQRLDAIKAQIAARVIGRYIVNQRDLALANYRGARQEVEPVSGGARQEAEPISGISVNAKPNGYLSTPDVRPVNWTRANTFAALQEWEGVVTAINSDHLVASLVDITAGKTRATEEAQIPLREINEQDLEKLVVGRIFRWAIGYQRLKTGTRKRTSNIVFRDLPQWTKRDFDEGHADAARLMRFLRSEEPRAEKLIPESSKR